MAATVDFTEILQLVGPFAALAGLVSGIWYRVEGKIEKVRSDADTAIEAANDKAHANEKALADFKLEVTKEYASWETVKAIETRLTERMDNLAESVMKMPDAIVDRIFKMVNMSAGK
jgi:hypothetical protein